MKHIRPLARASLISCLALSLFAPTLRADGTEQLGPPVGLALAPGSAIVAAGVGLDGVQPADLDVVVPLGAAVNQVILYWEGQTTSGALLGPQDTISVSGNVVTGDRIGGPSNFATFSFVDLWTATYRADITGLDLVSDGLSTLSISGADFDAANCGAGVLVVIDDGSAGDLQLQDGNDFAFANLAGSFMITAPVTFDFGPSATDRDAQLDCFFGSVGGARPSILTVQFDGQPLMQFIDIIMDTDGPEWDSLSLDLTVPASSTSVTIQALSQDSGVGPFAGNLEASLAWVAAAFAIEGMPPPDCTGVIGDFVWSDEDCDGIQEAGESGLSGVKVILCDSQGGVVDMQETGSDGSYLFSGLCAGTYSVKVDESTLPDGYFAGPCNQGGDDFVDNDCSPAMAVLPFDDSADRSVDFGFCPPPGGGEGCTPGYWKQPHHFDSWTAPYTPDTKFRDVFDNAFGNKTLLKVLRTGGGGLKALGRHTVAALLNAASAGVDYDLSVGQVIADFNAVYPSNKQAYNAQKDVFQDFNEQGCPLN